MKQPVSGSVAAPTDPSGSADAPVSDDAPPRRTREAIDWLVISGVALCSLVILFVLNPGLLLNASTPSGGDMGAHVLGPAYLRDVLLPGGQIQGWSNAWFAGFPIFYFYFPLPSLVIVFLDLFLPYGVAFKLVTVMGLLGLPPATYFFTRALGFDKSVAVVTAAAGAAFVFLENPTPQIFGGTIASTLAGEFSYSWSFALSLVYLGLLIKTVHESPRYLPWAGLALALTALSHVITTITIVFASLFVFAFRSKRQPEDTVGGHRRPRRYPAPLLVMLSWALGFAIAAVWALPLLARLDMTTDMNWQPLAGFDELAPPELWPIIVLAILGMAAAIRRTARAVPFIALTLIPLPAFFLLEQGSKLWNGRVLPHWFFGVHFFAGIAVGLFAVALARRLPSHISRWWVHGAAVAATVFMAFGANNRTNDVGVLNIPDWFIWSWLGLDSVLSEISIAELALILGGLLVVALFAIPRMVPTALVLPAAGVLIFISAAAVGVLTDEAYVDGWARWNYSGYEAKEPWPEYEAVMETISGLPPGRVQWEANSELNSYGTPMALMLFPYWTSGTHPSMEGLFFESSLTTPFHFLNAAELSNKPSNPIPGLRYHNFDFTRGVQHMQLFNVSYYVAYTEQAQDKADNHPGFELVAQSEPFKIYRFPESSLVDIALNRPWVYEEPSGGLLDTLAGVFRPGDEPEFVDVAFSWYEDIGLLDQWVVEDGPEEWERVGPELDGDTVFLSAAGEVSDIVLENDRISFRTTAVGVPHLVKVSYFPNWTATGAEGPWRATPSLMVVVPTDEVVELQFSSTWAENGGAWLSLIGIVVLATSWTLNRRRRRT